MAGHHIGIALDNHRSALPRDLALRMLDAIKHVRFLVEHRLRQQFGVPAGQRLGQPLADQDDLAHRPQGRGGAVEEQLVEARDQHDVGDGVLLDRVGDMIGIEQVVAGVGLVEANSENIDISCAVSGMVTQLYLKAGDRVGQGQKLLSLDERDMRAATHADRWRPLDGLMKRRTIRHHFGCCQSPKVRTPIAQPPHAGTEHCDHRPQAIQKLGEQGQTVFQGADNCTQSGWTHRLGATGEIRSI